MNWIDCRLETRHFDRCPRRSVQPGWPGDRKSICDERVTVRYGIIMYPRSCSQMLSLPYYRYVLCRTLFICIQFRDKPFVRRPSCFNPLLMLLLPRQRESTTEDEWVKHIASCPTTRPFRPTIHAKHMPSIAHIRIKSPFPIVLLVVLPSFALWLRMKAVELIRRE